MNFRRFVGVALVLFVLSACTDKNRVSPESLSCLSPALEKITVNKQAAVDIAAKLDKLPIDATLKTSFQNSITQDFSKLNDPNEAFYLYLAAIDCYVTHAKTPEEKKFILDLLQPVHQKFASLNGLSGISEDLTPVEQNMISKSKLSADIEGLYQRLNSMRKAG